jgi:hypothetical protein
MRLQATQKPNIVSEDLVKQIMAPRVWENCVVTKSPVTSSFSHQVSNFILQQNQQFTRDNKGDI